MSPAPLLKQRLRALCALLVLCLSTASSAQSPQPQAGTPFDAASRVYNVGRYDEVEPLLRTATDTRSLALRARAHVARGRYAEAEALLAGPAASSPGSDAALELGLLQQYLGRRAQARTTLQAVLASVTPATSDDYLRLARAARAVDEFRRANDLFREANRLAAQNAVINASWGELFLDTSESADAQQSFQIALKSDANYVPALVGLARTTLDTNPPVAKATLERALTVNPSYVPARLLVAELALDERRRDDAKAEIARALDVNPNDLDALALKAAIDRLEGRTAEFEQQVAAILKRNPVFGEAYRVAGDHLARNYRFDEAQELLQRALKIDPENNTAYADLGLNLLRTGDEAAARSALETAFKRNPFYSNLVTKNLLEMLDELDKFQTFREGDIVLRLHPDEAAVMREFVMPYAQLALTTLEKQYQFDAKGPILVEMFPKHDDFAVRTLGLPGMIGALGACFGRVVTLDSPKARPPGQFSWMGTLWHEMAHVITLQMSGNRVPRWLTEGISVFEEKRHRPEWGREMELSFAQALEAGKAFKLRDLNEGFSDPRMISLAYYQASLVAEHIVEAYGEPKLRELLRAYGRGLENEEAITAGLGITIEQLQTSFDAKIDREFKALRAALQAPEIPPTPTLDQLKTLAMASPGSFRVQMELAQALHEAGDGPAAIAVLEKAAALAPQATGDANPNALIALIATERGDAARAIQAYEALLKVDHTEVEAARRLAALLEKQNDPERAAAAYARVAELDPFDAVAQGVVGRHALQQKDTRRAIPALRAALAANPPDRAGAHIDLAEAYFSAGQLGEAKGQALAALEIAPSFERAQDLLLKIVDAQAPGGGTR
jgi:cellulose synthase operon protein C